MNELTKELRDLQYATFPEIFGKFRELSEKYGNMPFESMISAFATATGDKYSINDPALQNRRVKGISSTPANYTKDEVAKMVQNPEGSEMPLRQVEHALEYSAYPMFHIRKVYQDLLTYHNYVAPQFLDKDEAKRDAFWREWKLAEKLREAFDLKQNAHMIVGQAIQEGKVFYTPRYRVDKTHNKVEHAFMQQLPSDWVKIVGFNNVSKYTIAFNMMYFAEPGTDVRQFGDLFLPYVFEFADITGGEAPSGLGKTVVFGSKVNMAAYNARRESGGLRNVEAYYQNGRWFYWVTLPVDRVFTFEVDDVSRTVVSPFTGLFIDLIQLAQMESLQLELLQNPLVSILTGQIPYREDRDATTSDPYKLSNAGMNLFRALWYQMLTQNNTSGIGLYMAPLENMEMHQLAEAPSAMDIVQQGYSDTMSKAGLSAILPVSDDPRAGVAQISLSIESRFAEQIYKQFERMFRVILSKLNLSYDFRLKMFGSLATDKDMEEKAQKGMTLGILPDTLVFDAMHDRSIFEDIAVSDAILESKLMNRRFPLVTTYSAKNGDGNLPPQIKHDLNPGGRPDSGGQATSDGQEGDLDSYGE